MPDRRRSIAQPRPWVAGAALAVAALFAACSGDRRAVPPSTDDTRVFAATVVPATQAPPTLSGASPDTAPGDSALPAPAASAQIDRLIIPAAKIDAPFQVKGVNARNEMENPDGKDAVAWYDFSARPGFGSNAVFSGHIDWYTGERGVFWFLRNLNEGDDVLIRLTDGTTLAYRVARTEVVNASDAPVGAIVGPTETEAITLITCDGVFSRSTQDYDKRRIVRAHRVS